PRTWAGVRQWHAWRGVPHLSRCGQRQPAPPDGGVAPQTSSWCGIRQHAEWEDLLGVTEVSGVMGQFQPPHPLQVGGRKLQRHVVLFLHAHAVLPRDTPTEFDTDFQDVTSGLQDEGGFPGVMLVEGNSRMEITISSMSQIGNTQVITLANGRYPTQRLGQSGAWHTAIDDITV